MGLQSCTGYLSPDEEEIHLILIHLHKLDTTYMGLQPCTGYLSPDKEEIYLILIYLHKLDTTYMGLQPCTGCLSPDKEEIHLILIYLHKLYTKCIDPKVCTTPVFDSKWVLSTSCARKASCAAWDAAAWATRTRHLSLYPGTRDAG